MPLAYRVWLPPLLLVGLAGAALYLPRLGRSGLWDPWEPKYAQTPREMASRGDWIVPWFDGEPRLNKPPLTYWMIGAAQAVRGAHESPARLPSAALAVAAALALALALAVRCGPLEGCLAGAALLTAPQWVLLGRFATPDMPLAAWWCMALSAVIAMPAIRPGSGRTILAAAAVVAVGLAGLTDWPRGLLLPAWSTLAWSALRGRMVAVAVLTAACVAYYVAQHRYSAALNLAAFALVVLGAIEFGSREQGVRLRTWLLVLAALAIIVAPWFVLAYQREPAEMSVLEYKHAFNLGESPRAHQQPLAYVAQIVALGGLPWSAAAVAGFLRIFRRGGAASPEDLLSGALVGPLLYFSLAEAKMGHFYGVMQPASAGLAALGIAAWMRRADWRWIPAAAAAVLVGVAAWDSPARLLETATVKHSLFGYELAGTVAVAVVGWLGVLAAAKLLRRPWAAVAGLAPAALLAVRLGVEMVPALSPQKSMKHLWQAYLDGRGPRDRIAMTGEVKFGTIYYANGAIDEIDSAGELRTFLSGPGGRYLILPGEDFRERLERAPETFGRWETVDDSHPSHRLVRRPGP